MPSQNPMRLLVLLVASLEMLAGLAHEREGVLSAQEFDAAGDHLPPPRHDWRSARLPRISRPPDPQLISWEAEGHGWAIVRGGRGCAPLDRAGLVHIVNLQTGDQTSAAVRADGAFSARVFAPPGSSLQLAASLVAAHDAPPGLRSLLRSPEGAYLNSVPGHWAIAVGGFAISIDQFSSPTTSPGAIVHIPSERGTAFVQKVGPDQWLYGTVELSRDHVAWRTPFFADIVLHTVASKPLADLAAPPHVIFAGNLLFDAAGRQHPSRGRMSASHLLTPTGLPIETMGELVTERQPNGETVGTPGGAFAPLGHHLAHSERWDRIDDRHAVIRQRYVLEMPESLPPGLYGLALHVLEMGEEFDAGPQVGQFRCAGLVRVGDPAPPRIATMLLACTGSGGTRGAVAREDRGHYGLNFRNSISPEILIVARDDAFTGQPLTYQLDPYVPLLGLMDRPAPVVPPSPIPLDFRSSRLTVSVRAPSGDTTILGPAPLAYSQCDNTVLRPDTVIPGRIVPPIPPTFGNPSLAEIHHLSGRGAFDYTFLQYGHYTIELSGEIADDGGRRYGLSGTYDVYVAREMDVELFPEPGTPLYPDRAYHPQVRVVPPRPVQVVVRVRHVPRSLSENMTERVITGRANRWGIFVADRADAISFSDTGEYVCDVTVSHQDPDGTLWMASRRGASIVADVEPELIAHGERGNRSPSGTWRARWFRAGVPNFVSPPPAWRPAEPVPRDPNSTAIHGIELGHTCYPYESGDVAWLGDSLAFSLFPNITFEDSAGTVANLIERRWPGVRRGEGRAGLYPDQAARPEDRHAIGELPYVNITSSGLPASVDPSRIEQWGYFYTTSWRPGVAVRSQVSEDMLPAGYWFFDDPYGFQFGNAPHGDLAGDFKMNYAGGVFRDVPSGTAHYSAYASMLVLIDKADPLGPRVMPPFDGLVPGSPPSGPLLVAGDQRYDLFLTFGAAGPGALLEQNQPVMVSGVMWPPVAGHVDVSITSPSGIPSTQRLLSDAMGVFHGLVTQADEVGVWTVRVEGTATGKTSVGVLSELVAETELPRGGGIGLIDCTYPLVVTRPDTAPIRFDIPAGSRARPPHRLVIRGRVPARAHDLVQYLVQIPGQVIDSGELSVHDGMFEYVYDPERLAVKFPNLDTRILNPHSHVEPQSAWFDTVSLSFWAGSGVDLAAGAVVLQGEELFACDVSGEALPEMPRADAPRDRPRRDLRVPWPAPAPWTGLSGSHSSLMRLSADGRTLFVTHPWSEELVRMNVMASEPEITATTSLDGRPRALALSCDGSTVYVSLSDTREIAGFHMENLKPAVRFGVPGEPRGLVVSPDGDALYVADFEADKVRKFCVTSGAELDSSDVINRPHALAMTADGGEIYATSFRTGSLLTMDADCKTVRHIPAPEQLNQAVTATLAGDGLLYIPQTRSDTAVGGRMFDRTVFPTVAVANPRDGAVRMAYHPDLLVTPPHRPVEVAVDPSRVYVACAGSDDVLALDRTTGLAVWHTRSVGEEPAALALDATGRRIYIMTVTGQDIVTLAADSGRVLSRTKFTRDPTPRHIARGRYLFQTATDRRLTKDQWMSCAACHPDGHADGRQWDFGHGPLDTAPLLGIVHTAPLHPSGHLDEIQDTYDFTRRVMAGQWFVPRDVMHDYLGPSNARLCEDLDALAAYIHSLEFRDPPAPSVHDQLRFTRGREIFFSPTTGCARCHPPPYYTDSGQRDAGGTFVRHDVGTSRTGGPAQLDTPTLLGLSRSEPYLHHGGAQTLEEVISTFNRDDRHGRTSHLDADDRRALATFLKYLTKGLP